MRAAPSDPGLLLEVANAAAGRRGSEDPAAPAGHAKSEALASAFPGSDQPAPDHPVFDTPASEVPGARSTAHLLSLIASGQAASRSDLVRSSGLAPSTVSSRVETLIKDGWVTEGGYAPSRGGRRARTLTINAGAGYLLVSDIGSTHARVIATDLAGASLAEIEGPLDLGVGPERVADRIAQDARVLSDHPSVQGRVLRGAVVAIPGPVDRSTGRVVSPSRMPGWNDCPFGELLGDRLDVPTVIENDARLIALGLVAGTGAPVRNLVVVKIGGGIGCGIITDGRLYRGESGVAGDISHNRVADAANRPCSCGNEGCLETIASGAALVRDLAAADPSITSVAHILASVQHNDPVATTAVRTAGRQIGEVLAPMINFINPQALFLAGHLSVAEPLVAAVRSVIYQRCLPAATRSLTIAAVQDRNLNIRAAVALVLPEVGSVST